MIKQRTTVGVIPTIIWGNSSPNVFIAVHGFMSSKEDQVIELLAKVAVNKGYQVISFDLPQHGDRKATSTPFEPKNCVDDLNIILTYVKQSWSTISLFACSIGAYFSLQAFKKETFKQSLFLSPIVDMRQMIEKIMNIEDITITRLKVEKKIITKIGQTLDWDYYQFVLQNPIVIWNNKTAILYGSLDDQCEYSLINKFVEKYHCEFDIIEAGEHFFHTEEQLTQFTNWLEKMLVC